MIDIEKDSPQGQRLSALVASSFRMGVLIAAVSVCGAIWAISFLVEGK